MLKVSMTYHDICIMACPVGDVGKHDRMYEG
jgi:hypothetical protein